MEEKTYAIEMQTPLGIKRGSMRVRIDRNDISGFLDLMNHSEPFCGKISEEGCCEFTGRMITLMRTIEYRASGKLDQDQISLEVYGERNVFWITGTACAGKKEI